MAHTAYREVVVRPLSSWREASYVLGLVAFIVFLVSIRVNLQPKSEAGIFKEAYHRLDTDLNDIERPLYQAFLAAENELLFLWGEKGDWPDAALLSEEGIPPFASDMMPISYKDYKWTTYNRGQWVDYLGIAGPGMPSALLRVINLHADYHPHPHPGSDYDPNQKAALQIWMHPETAQRYAGMQLIERGWSWLLSANDPILKIKVLKAE